MSDQPVVAGASMPEQRAMGTVADPQPPTPNPHPPSIEVAGVSRWYGAVVAVSDVSFAVGPGITGLLGPNGAGKTTLLRMLSGLLSPSQGQIRVLGQTVRGNP